jgi:hypothetical protein
MTVLFYGCNFRGRLSSVPDVRSAFVKLRTGANSGVSIFSIKQSSREVETKKSESSSREISKCFFFTGYKCLVLCQSKQTKWYSLK